MYANKLVTTRRATENKTTSCSQVMESGRVSSAYVVFLFFVQKKSQAMKAPWGPSLRYGGLEVFGRVHDPAKIRCMRIGAKICTVLLQLSCLCRQLGLVWLQAPFPLQLSCPLCGEPDSALHILSGCKHSTISNM
eukprot:845256-Pelagomonas_calceolata.AAC.1